jgi:hypothetical protein
MFDVVIFATALYALMSETIEDVVVLIIYQIMFGKKNVIYGLVSASIIISIIMVTLVIFGIPNLEVYSEYITYGSGVFLIGLGSYWILRFWLVKRGFLGEDSVDSKASVKSITSFMLVFVELLEILAILIPFTLANYVIEVSLSSAVSVIVSLGLVFFVGSKIRKRLENQLTQVKVFAGMALVVSGIVIIVNIR